MPWSLRIALIVLRATSGPTCFSPPRIRVYPQVRVLGRHAHDECGDVRLSARATGAAALRAVIFLGHEPAIPPQDGVGCDDAGDGRQGAPAEDFALDGQAAPLVVGEAQASGWLRRPEAPVLLEQIVNDRLLLPVDPTGEEQQEKGERRRQRIHRESVPEALPRFKDLLSRAVDWAEFPEARAL